MVSKRYITKYALTGESYDSWANDGPVVWAEDIAEALTQAETVLDRDAVRTPRRPLRIISVEEIPYYAK